jgi:hypothetical protein
VSRQHRPWPYPRSREELVQVAMTLLAVLLIGVVGTAAQAHHYENKALNQDNIEQAASALGSYSTEASELISQTIHDRSSENYREIYLERLDEQAQQVTEFIGAHKASGSLEKPAQKLISDGTKLQKLTKQAATKSDTATLNQILDKLQKLQTELESFEEKS